MQQQIAHGTAHKGQPLASRRSNQGLKQLGRNARNLHSESREEQRAVARTRSKATPNV
jgi:hypothetical protein